MRTAASTAETPVPQGLYDVFVEARSKGLIGDQPIGRQVAHAGGFAHVCNAELGGRLGEPTFSNGRWLLDLGAGGGLPGLVLACSPPAAIVGVVLLEASQRRADWLRTAIAKLQIADRAEVLAERAELAGRTASRRWRYDVVVARAFGRPAVTAECAAPLLRVGGLLVVAEPPGIGTPIAELDPSMPSLRLGSADPERWPPDGLAELGLGPAVAHTANGFAYAAMRVLSPCSDRYPRRTGAPAKRPLF